MPGPLGAFAAAGDGETQPAAPLRCHDLSLYAAAEHKARYVEPEAGQVEQSVAALRKLVEPYTDWCRGNIQPKVQSVVRFGNDAYACWKNPPKDFYPRAGVIGFTGILGLFLARGSRIKKAIYPAGLVTVSASLYYPEQAVAIAKSAGDSVYDRAVRSYAAVEKMLKPHEDPESAARP